MARIEKKGSAVSSINVTASNGLTSTITPLGNNITLGGVLTNNTSIIGINQYSVNFNGLVNFNVFTTNSWSIVNNSYGTIAASLLLNGIVLSNARRILLNPVPSSDSTDGVFIQEGSQGASIRVGNGSPNGVITARSGSIYMNANGTVWVRNGSPFVGNTWTQLAVGASYTASNGLSLSGTDFRLGGTLSANTLVVGAGFDFDISSLSNLVLDATDAAITGTATINLNSALFTLVASEANFVGDTLNPFSVILYSEIVLSAQSDVTISSATGQISLTETRVSQDFIAEAEARIFHVSGSGTGPTISAGAAIGAGGTATRIAAECSDTAGRFTINTGTSGVGGGVMATMTFQSTYTVAPVVVLVPENEAAKTMLNECWITPTATGFSVVASAAYSAVSQTCIFGYHVIKPKP